MQWLQPQLLAQVVLLCGGLHLLYLVLAALE
jgi:hypothetical protein